MSIEEKLTTVAENVPKVYEAGQKSGADTFGTLATVTGSSKVIADYVHPTEHKVGVKVASKNLFDEQLEIGGINTTTGENNDNVSTTLRTKNYIKVLPLTSYFVTSPTGLCAIGGLIQIYRYDENKNFIGYGSTGIENQTITTGGNWYYIRFAIRAEYGTVYNNDICISLGTTSTTYTPYIDNLSNIEILVNDNTYTSNADGVVEGVTSISPTMNFSCDNDSVAITVEYYEDTYEIGVKSEYDRFWDTYQQNGNRTDYSMSFAGIGWNNTLFKPKYPINLTNAESMFYGSAITEIGYNEEIDFYNASSVYALFKDSKIEKIKAIDISKNTQSKTFMCGYCYRLHTIETLIVSAATTFVSNMFQSCTALKSINISGVIGQNGLSFQWSTNLSKESIISVINALSTTTEALVVTLSETAVRNAFEITGEIIESNPECAEWYALKNTRGNWTITLS